MANIPRQANLPKARPQITQFQDFNKRLMARVTSNATFDTDGKISVVFLNRTSPVPIWVLDPSVGKPEIGDFVLVGYIDGQKNNPYMAGIFAHQAYTSNFIRVEKDMIRIQYPLQAQDVTGTSETDPKSHLRNDTQYLSTRAYLQIDANGVMFHAPGSLPIKLQASTVQVLNEDGSTRTTL